MMQPAIELSVVATDSQHGSTNMNIGFAKLSDYDSTCD